MAARSRRKRRSLERPQTAAAPAATPSWLGWGWALGLFAAAFSTRLLFWRATTDHAWPHTAFFKGDALLWLDYARALRTDQPFELGLPIHPPGTAWLVAILWDVHAGGLPLLKISWCAMGAAAVLLAAVAGARSFGHEVGRLTGALLVGWSSLLMVSTSINVEAPYLVFAMGALALTESARTRPGLSVLAAWGAVNAAACLFRVEHVAFWAPATAWLAFSWRRDGAAPARVARDAAWVGAVFVLVLIPWHLQAWSALHRFNTQPLPLPAEHPVARLRPALVGVRWEPEAARAREDWPGFARDISATFVAATVAHRGGTSVRAQDVAILDEAFGEAPRPLPSHPFVSAYGPLNFALASHPAAGVGFSTVALEEPPPLASSAARYPPALVQGLPPPELAFTYPPHVALFNHGYAIGWRWLKAQPGHALARAARRLGRSWVGATSGLSGYALPGGLRGARRPAVDLALPPPSLAARTWSALCLLGAFGGAVLARHRPLLVPWLIFLATKVAVAAVFFGYARLGATAAPVVSALCAVTILRLLEKRAVAAQARARGTAVLLALLVVLDLARWASPPRIRIDGTPAGPRDPVAAGDHRDHSLDVE